MAALTSYGEMAAAFKVRDKTSADLMDAEAYLKALVEDPASVAAALKVPTEAERSW